MKKLKMTKKVFSLNYKKANAVFETIVILVVILAFAITTIFGYNSFKDLNAELQLDDTISTQGKTQLNNFQTDYPSMFDWVSIFIIVMLTIGGMVSAFMIETNPIFFIVTIVLLISVFVLAAYLNNIFFETMETSDLADFPITNWVFNNLIKVFVISAFMIGLALFAKSRA